MEIIQVVFHNLYMHMYFILTRTTEMLCETNSTNFTLPLDVCILNSFWIISERIKKRGSSCLFFTVFQYHSLPVSCWLMQYKWKKKGIHRFLGHVSCLGGSHCFFVHWCNHLRLFHPTYTIINVNCLSFTYLSLTEIPQITITLLLIRYGKPYVSVGCK